MNIKIIIPTYNERHNITALVAAIHKVSLTLPDNLTILIVDSNSPDGTGQTIQKIIKEYPKGFLTIITQKKTGLGKAYKLGFEQILATDSYDAVMQMDADFSHNPAYIPLLIKELTNADFVIGSRYIKGGETPDDWSLSRFLISKFSNWAVRKISDAKNINDYTAGFKAIKISLLKKIDFNKIKSNGYFFQIELLNQALGISKKSCFLKAVFNIWSPRGAGRPYISLLLLTNGFLEVPYNKFVS